MDMYWNFILGIENVPYQKHMVHSQETDHIK